MASDYNYKSQMSQVFSDFIQRVKEKMELFAERKKIDRSDSAPAPDISVTRSAQLRSWSGACSEERPLRSRSCPSLVVVHMNIEKR